MRGVLAKIRAEIDRLKAEPLAACIPELLRRKNPGGDWLDDPADPQHPHEDLMDALRGGVRDRFPEGRIEQPRLRSVRADKV